MQLVGGKVKERGHVLGHLGLDSFRDETLNSRHLQDDVNACLPFSSMVVYSTYLFPFMSPVLSD